MSVPWAWIAVAVVVALVLKGMHDRVASYYQWGAYGIKPWWWPWSRRP